MCSEDSKCAARESKVLDVFPTTTGVKNSTFVAGIVPGALEMFSCILLGST